jgi:cell division septum initiation protein DivIVA
MEITARELRDIEIHSEIRGYSRDEVNDLLERAAVAIEASTERVTQLQQRLTSAQTEAVGNRETEDILHRTLLLAQRAADEAVAEATAKSRQMLDEAEMSARRLVADSEADARRRGDSERRRLEDEIVDLASRRDTLLADVEALTRFESEYRERMVRALESDLTVLRSRPTTGPTTPPETSDVEIPVKSSAPSPAAPAAPPSAPGASTPPTPDAGPARPGAPASTSTGPSAPASPVSPAPGAPSPDASRGGSGGGAAPNATGAPSARAGSRSAPGTATTTAPSSVDLATSEVDVRTLFEPARDGAEETGEHAGASRPGRSIDLESNGGGSILDDDAFFATLRDAVHDEKPLGPRDEDDETGENAFFDQDADRGSFRDVFRRRR